MHKISQIKTLSNGILWVEFKDGRQVLYDVEALSCSNPAFLPLFTETALFANARRDAGGYGVSWNDDIDLSAEELWNNGTLLKDETVLTPGCKCPTCGQMIRRKSEAQATASRANLAKRKNKGGRPVNPTSERQRKHAAETAVYATALFHT